MPPKSGKFAHHQNLDGMFQSWRTAFLDALERRELVRCHALLSQLRQYPEPWLQHAEQHYTAVLDIEMHRYDSAERALTHLLTEPLSPEQRPRTLMELAILCDEQGEWGEADRRYAEAFSAYAELANPLGMAKVNNNWAISLCFRYEQGAQVTPGQAPLLQRAFDLHTQARTLAGALESEGEWETAKSWHGLGKVLAHRHNYAAAEAAFNTYIALCIDQENEHACGYTYTDLARWIYLPQNRLDEAMASVDKALPICQRYSDPLNLAEALWVRGSIAARQGNPNSALSSYDAAIESAESIRSRLTAPTSQIRYRATIETLYTAPVTLHFATHNPAAAFTAAERGKARVLADLLAGQSPRPHVGSSKRLLAAQRRLFRNLDAIYAAEAAGETPTATNHDVARLEQELAMLDRRIELEDPTYAGLTMTQPFTAEQVQAHLPEDAALLTWTGEPDEQIWTVVVTRDGVVAEPAPRDITFRRLQTLIGDYLDGPRRGNLVPAPGSGRLGPVRLYSELYQRLIAPVLGALNGAHTIYIAPTGPLHHIPMGGLTPAPDCAPWTAGRRVVYAPSATVLFGYCFNRPASPRKGVLALAPNDAHLHLIQPAAERIARMVGGAASVGADATTAMLLRRARFYRILCFLGHAVFDRRHPMMSRLQLADGRLHASEILRTLRLQTDLTILAACETARAEAPRGDEILGLSRAMLYAGTPSLISTLWRVHEIPTRLLMEHLMTALGNQTGQGEHFDPAAALMEAQQFLRTLTFEETLTSTEGWGVTGEMESQLDALWAWTHTESAPQAGSRIFEHPFFWSPYVLIGERRSQQRH